MRILALLLLLAQAKEGNVDLLFLGDPITQGWAHNAVRQKAVVLMIGRNNFGLHGDAPGDVAKGVAAIVQTLRKKLPASKILELNRQIAALEDRKSVRFLHFSEKGCQIGADAMEPLLAQLAGK